MYLALKIVHIIALALFVGSIPAHIVLGAAADRAGDALRFATYHEAKQLLTVGLTFSGLVATLASGSVLVLARRSILRQRWLRAKLLLVALVVVNGALVLTPLATEMAELAKGAVSSGVLPELFHELRTRERVAGALNLFALTSIIVLAVAKPFGADRRVPARSA